MGPLAPTPSLTVNGFTTQDTREWLTRVRAPAQFGVSKDGRARDGLVLPSVPSGSSGLPDQLGPIHELHELMTAYKSDAPCLISKYSVDRRGEQFSFTCRGRDALHIQPLGGDPYQGPSGLNHRSQHAHLLAPGQALPDADQEAARRKHPSDAGLGGFLP
jgi:hypothetical protein